MSVPPDGLFITLQQTGLQKQTRCLLHSGQPPKGTTKPPTDWTPASTVGKGKPLTSPGVDSASNRNEYQEYFLGVKAAGAYGSQPYHLHVPIILKSGGLNLLEPSGTVQACNGIALPFYLYLASI